MQFLTISEFSKEPNMVFSKLAHDGKIVITESGKPQAIMITVNTENFEQVFAFIEEIEKRFHVQEAVINDKERLLAFERLMQFHRKKSPTRF